MYESNVDLERCILLNSSLCNVYLINCERFNNEALTYIYILLMNALCESVIFGCM